MKVGDRVHHWFAGAGIVVAVLGKNGSSLRVKYDYGQTGGGYTSDYKLLKPAPPATTGERHGG